MLVAYMRVSTPDQSLEVQETQLREAGCEEFFGEKASGAKRDRPQLNEAIKFARKGDVLVVQKLDRVSRSLKDMLDILEKLEQKGVGFRSLTESVDTTTNAGRMMMQMLGAFAEFERNMIRSRVNDGMQQAKRRGVKFGRPRALDQSQREAVIEMHEQGKSYSEIGRIVGCSYQTIARVCQARSNDTAETAAPNQAERNNALQTHSLRGLIDGR